MKRTALLMMTLVAAAIGGCAHTGPEPRSIRSQAFDALARCNYGEAERLYRQAVAEDRSNAYSYLNLAVAQQWQGKLEAARFSYQTALDLGEDLPVAVTTVDDPNCRNAPEPRTQAAGSDNDTIGEIARANLAMID